jgi:hypothetical protein
MDAMKKTSNSRVGSWAKVLKASSVAGTGGSKKAPGKKASATITPEQRFKMIEQTAYFRAEKHGFQVDPRANWLAAEAEVNALLAKKAKK